MYSIHSLSSPAGRGKYLPPLVAAKPGVGPPPTVAIRRRGVLPSFRSLATSSQEVDTLLGSRTIVFPSSVKTVLGARPAPSRRDRPSSSSFLSASVMIGWFLR